MKKPIYILGISESHTASAALLKNGELIACTSEERFTRKKLQSGIPTNAINYCLEFANITAKDLSEVALADIIPMFVQKKDSPFATANKLRFFSDIVIAIEGKIEEVLPASRYLFYKIYKFVMNLKVPQMKKIRLKKLQKVLPAESKNFSFYDHHLCHMAAALFSSNLVKNTQPVAIFTCDGVGDFECATLSKFQNLSLKKLISIDSQQSLGFFYLHITQFLGLKPVEDEYKVMGLAAYQDDRKNTGSYRILKTFFKINRSKPGWQIKLSAIHLQRKLPKLLQNQRFDQVAAAAQKILEEILVEWIKNAIKKYTTINLAFGGGVFANVKANQKIAQLKNVNHTFFMPSPSDESNAIGAAYYAYFKLTKSLPKPLTSLYLGPNYSESEIAKILKKYKKQFNIKKPQDINLVVAKILAEGQVVARFAGRMEFGQRALGNRSILANPKNREVVDFINQSIKSRDFWMPFAPTILRERTSDYLVLHKADSPFMNVAFDTTPKGQKDLAAAIHPYDKTTRPQILDRKINPAYYDLIKKFEKLTGIGALLNTSFNLHGEPIVATPEDAIRVFKKTKLKHLVLEQWLISKK